MNRIRNTQHAYADFRTGKMGELLELIERNIIKKAAVQPKRFQQKAPFA